MLQFGHDLSAVETPSSPVKPGWQTTASIRPRPFSRGNISVLLNLFWSISASIRPRPFSRGNTDYDDPICGHLLLQFGHDLSAVETSSKSLSKALGSMLQFGHDLSAVETSCHDWRSDHEHRASIRPRPFSRGNRYLFLILNLALSCFNSATTFQPWKHDGSW